MSAAIIHNRRVLAIVAVAAVAAFVAAVSLFSLLGSSIPEGFVEIPAGSFTQGSPPDEEGRFDDEVQRRVTISRPFLLQATPVTQGEWRAVMGSNPSHFIHCGANCPVETVNWFDAVAYLNKLSEREGLEACYEGSGTSVDFKGLSCKGYRLPTEAEWEYAARAGTAGPRYGALNDVAWHRWGAINDFAWDAEKSENSTQPVRGKQANAWGLHDMIGNVWEWNGDWYGDYSTEATTDPTGPSAGYYRVNRGCSWATGARDCRAARRASDLPAGCCTNAIGFRPARSIP